MSKNQVAYIENYVIENLATKKLNGSQLRIISLIWRYTYGEQRDYCELSEKEISKGTNLHPMTVQKDITRLINRHILLEKQRPSYGQPRVYAFNKNVDEWR